MRSVACLLFVVIAGCGGGGEAPKFLSQLVPVKGQVTRGGEPLAGVIVTYLPQEGTGTGEIATGMTDAKGEYSLRTLVTGQSASRSQGAVPGEYRVTITKLVMPDGSAVPADTTDADAEALGAKQLLPPEYSDPTATKLTATVAGPSSTNNFEIPAAGQ